MPFRFGVALWQARGRAEWVAAARKIEALGYGIVTAPDHLTDRLAPRLRVGGNVLNNDLRHPVLVAREAATVDLLTDGRLRLGLGAGSIRAEYALLAGERVDFAGKHYRVQGHKLEYLPVQKPRPPILIGGNGRRLLTLAAKEADVVGFSGIDFRDGGAAAPDLSGWRVEAVDERVRLVRVPRQPLCADRHRGPDRRGYRGAARALGVCRIHDPRTVSGRFRAGRGAAGREMTTMKITGGCHCGHIAYEAEVDPATVRVCHCTDCQKLTGTAFRANIASLDPIA